MTDNKLLDIDNIEPGLFIEKQSDGRYSIVAVSTVAVPDADDETFTTDAMDYDIENAYKEQKFPEFSMFHRKGLSIGKVDKMVRIGIFAVDSGVSYDDPFSISVCEKMLLSNDGKWKVSKGFRVLEASGGCQRCGETLVIGLKHMVVGFRCPSCGNVTMSYKGILKDVHFRKTRTFEVTVTDVPAVPWTGVQAFPVDLKMLSEDFIMNKELIKQKLIEAGLPEDLVDERLKEVDVDVLKSLNLDAIPDAIMLKEILDGKPAKVEPSEEIIEMDDEILKHLTDSVVTALKDVVPKEVRSALEGLTIEVDGMEGVEVEVKELPDIIELKQKVDLLVEAVNSLLGSEEKRLKELLDSTSRNGRLKLRRIKCADTDDDDDDDDDDTKPVEKKEVSIVGSGGKEFSSMTELIKN